MTRSLPILLLLAITLASCKPSYISGNLIGVASTKDLKKSYQNPIDKTLAKTLLLPKMILLPPDSVTIPNGARAAVPTKAPVPSFLMSSHEITVAQYCVFLNDKVAPLRSKTRQEAIAQLLNMDSGGLQIKVLNQQLVPMDEIQASYPIVNVTWDGAMAYCKWLSDTVNSHRAASGTYYIPDYRLPSETEWLLAASARGTVSASMQLTPVSRSPKNSLGISGLRRNAAEWCLDKFAENPLGRDDLFRRPSRDQPKPPKADMLVRGYCNKHEQCDRFAIASDASHPRVGFRVAMSMLGMSSSTNN